MFQLPCLALFLSCGLAHLPGLDAKSAAASPEQLIQQLGSREYRLREQASQALASLGVDALPALLKAKNASDPEVRRRIEELVPMLERAQALLPKLVTLHMTEKPLKDVLAELSKQTGYKIATWPDGNVGGKSKQLFTFHFDKLTFWQALEKIGEVAGCGLQSNNWGDDGLRLMAMESAVPFVFLTGPFKVTATGFNYGRSNSFALLSRQTPGTGWSSNEYLQLNVQIAVEPKLPILRVGAIKLLVAEDEQGSSMVPPKAAIDMGLSQRFYSGGSYRSVIHSTQTSLVWPSKSARFVRTLKGVVPVTLLADQRPTVVTDQLMKSKGKKIKVGTTQFNLEDVTELPGKQVQIKLSITEENKDNPNDYTRINTLQQRIELRDDKDTKLNYYFNSISTNGPTTAQYTFVIQPGGGTPTKLLYYSWSLMEYDVAFELRDLPLP